MTTIPLGAFPRGKATAPRVFSATGRTTYVVPAGITEIAGKCWGAGGGAGATSANPGGNGAAGGFVQARFTVTPGETLTIYVPTGGTGSGTVLIGGGGGSFAGVFRGTTPLLVAAGGGGGGAGRSGNAGSAGGAGGSTAGQAGGTTPSGGAGGGGGTQSAGGSGGVGANGNASSGAKWIGGNSYGSTIAGGTNGASADLGASAGNGGGSASSNASGGGGGAGWYGGGGGGRGSSVDNTGGGGGGGGSSYVNPIGTGAVNTSGSGTTAPNQTDFSYISTRGEGGTPSSTPSVRNGKSGLVVLLI